MRTLFNAVMVLKVGEEIVKFAATKISYTKVGIMINVFVTS